MIEVRDGGLDHPQVIALLRLHLAGMAENSPAEYIHALDLGGLGDPAISFWTAWRDAAVLGCGALRELDAAHGEIKSMRTAPAHLRAGVGAAILEHIVAVARCRGYRRLSLETGSGPAFDPAHALYRRFGFTEYGPFADYPASPFTRFMSRAL